MDAPGTDPLSTGASTAKAWAARARGRVVRLVAAIGTSLLLTGLTAFAQIQPDDTVARLLDVPLGQPCTETGAAVEIEGVGRAVYDRVAFDGAAGTATLQGGVCVELTGVRVRLRAGRIDLAGLNDDGPATLRADGVVLDVAAWRLGVGSVAGSVDAPTMRDVVLIGPGVVGRAEQGGLVDGGFVLSGVRVASDAYRIDAREATLVGSDLVLRDASGTSCTCRIERYRLFGSEIRTPIDGGTTTVSNARVRLLGLDVPLGETLVLRGDGSDVALPIVVEGRDELGTVVAWRGSDAKGAALEVGASTDRGAWPLLTLRVRPDGDAASLAFDRRGLTLEASKEHTVAGDVTVRGVTVTDLRADEPLLRNGVEVRSPEWSRTESDRGVEARTTVSLRGGVDLAAEPARDVASPRTPVRLDAALQVPLGSAAELEMAVRGDAIGYPGLPGGSTYQAAATGTARLRVDAAGFAGEAFAVRRVTIGASPFTFDAIEERARIGTVVTGSAGPFDARLRAEWRFSPEAAGAEELAARLGVTLVDEGTWTASVAAEADVAGVYGGPDDEDWIEASASVAHAGGVHLGFAHRWSAETFASRSWTVRAGYERSQDARIGFRLERDTLGGTWSTVEASGAWPIDVEGDEVDVRLVPRAALDVAPWIEGDASGPEWSEHGLTVYLDDCCGTLRLGYLYDAEDGLAIDVGVVLPPLRFEPLPSADLPDLPPLPSTYGGAP